MAITSRQTAREALGTLLTTEMTGSGNPVHTVYDYLKSSFGGLSPVICIGSASVEGPGLTFQGYEAFYGFVVVSYVARDGGEEDAEDELDQVAQKLFTTLESNRSTSNWKWIGYAGPSTIEPVTIEGDPYWMEITPVVVREH